MDGGEYIAQLKVGADGMTSDANYDMKVPDETFDDTNIVATDVVLLQIVAYKTGEVILDVPNANSNFNTRPLKGRLG